MARSDSNFCKCGNACGYACLLWVDLYMHLFILDTCCVYGERERFQIHRGLATEVELHNVWITEKILLSGQGKPGHMQSHKLLSGVKVHEKHHKREREYCHLFNLGNAQTDQQLQRICVLWGLSRCFSLSGSLTRSPAS